MKSYGAIGTDTFEKQAGENSRWGLFTGDDLVPGVLAELVIYSRAGRICDRVNMSKHDLEMLKKACEDILSE